MKKAKIVLSVIGALAIVGGAAAFKAKADNYCVYMYDAEKDICPRVPNLMCETTIFGNLYVSATTRNALNCPSEVPTADCKFTFGTLCD